MIYEFRETNSCTQETSRTSARYIRYFFPPSHSTGIGCPVYSSESYFIFRVYNTQYNGKCIRNRVRLRFCDVATPRRVVKTTHEIFTRRKSEWEELCAYNITRDVSTDNETWIYFCRRIREGLREFPARFPYMENARMRIATFGRLVVFLYVCVDFVESFTKLWNYSWILWIQFVVRGCKMWFNDKIFV